MRVIALILVVVAAHIGYRGAMTLGSSLQDGGNLASGPEGLIYLLLAGALLLAASLIHRLQLFSITPARTVNMNEHNHVPPPDDVIVSPPPAAFSGITSPATSSSRQSKSSEGGGRTFLVDFDIEQIRLGRWEAKGRKGTDEDVRVWLMSLGYIPTPDGWLGDDTNLAQFERNEIVRCRSIARSNSQLEESRRRQVRQTIKQWTATRYGRPSSGPPTA